MVDKLFVALRKALRNMSETLRHVHANGTRRKIPKACRPKCPLETKSNMFRYTMLVSHVTVKIVGITINPTNTPQNMPRKSNCTPSQMSATHTCPHSYNSWCVTTYLHALHRFRCRACIFTSLSKPKLLLLPSSQSLFPVLHFPSATTSNLTPRPRLLTACTPPASSHLPKFLH